MKANLLCFILIFKQELVFRDEYNLPSMKSSEIENLYVISLLSLIFEYEYFTANDIFEEYYNELLENEEYWRIVCQTKKFILSIFYLKTKNHKDREDLRQLELIKRRLKGLKDIQISDSIRKDFSYFYNIIIRKSKKSVKYKRHLHKEFFFMFIIECKIQLKMKRDDYILFLNFFKCFNNEFYIDMKKNISSSKKCMVKNIPASYKQQLNSVPLVIDFKMFGIFFFHFTNVLIQFQKIHEEIKIKSSLGDYLKDHVTPRQLLSFITENSATFFISEANFKQLLDFLELNEYGCDDIVIIYAEPSVYTDTIEFWLRDFFVKKEKEIDYFKKLFFNTFHYCINEAMIFMEQNLNLYGLNIKEAISNEKENAIYIYKL